MVMFVNIQDVTKISPTYTSQKYFMLSYHYVGGIYAAHCRKFHWIFKEFKTIDNIFHTNVLCFFHWTVKLAKMLISFDGESVKMD